MFYVSFTPFKYSQTQLLILKEIQRVPWEYKNRTKNNEEPISLVTILLDDLAGYFQKRAVWLQLLVYSFLLYQEYRVFTIVTCSDYFLKFLNNRKTLKRNLMHFL